MKLCSFEHNGKPGYGSVDSAGDVVSLREALGAQAPESLDRLIEAVADGSVSLDQVRSAARTAKAITPTAGAFRWRPPVLRPSKIIGVAINNRQLAAMAFRPFANPAFFLKPPSALTGHNEPIVVKKSYGITHPEPELAVVIGRRAKNVAEKDALDHVFGYSIINDITSPSLKELDSIEVIVPPKITATLTKITWRKMLNEEHANSFYYTYHTLSKGADTFGPIGPWIVTRDEIQNPNNLRVDGYWEDTKICEDSTANLTFSVQKIIAHASSYLTLEPGDIVHCGTAWRAVNPKFPTLAACNIVNLGGSLSVEIEGIGRLRNPVRSE